MFRLFYGDVARPGICCCSSELGSYRVLVPVVIYALLCVFSNWLAILAGLSLDVKISLFALLGLENERNSSLTILLIDHRDLRQKSIL